MADEGFRARGHQARPESCRGLRQPEGLRQDQSEDVHEQGAKQELSGNVPERDALRAGDGRSRWAN
eukprot:4693574-Pyramimonas_sp.AAC.1